MKAHFILVTVFILSTNCTINLIAQDSLKVNTAKEQSSASSADNLPIATRKHVPQIATRRSALIPGWGQAYNKQYWKIPIVYGALAIPAATYFFNDSYYKKTKFAYEAVYAFQNGDNSLLPLIDHDVKRADGSPLSLSTYESARNAYRRNRDYSILYFVLMWGLNVADATVFGHLKNFDVGNDLTLKVKPTLTPNTLGPGIGLVLTFKNTPHTTSSNKLTK